MPSLLYRFACLTLFALLAAVGPPARAETLRVALVDVAPYAYSVGGQARGRYVSLVRELLAGSGLEAEFSLVPFARSAVALGGGVADLTLSFATESLEATALALGPVLRVESVIVSPAARPVQRIADLRGATVGRARGGCQDLAAQSEALQLHWREVNAFDNALRMLRVGRLDALCLTHDVLQHYSDLAGIPRAQLGPALVIGERAVVLYARRDLPLAVVERLRVQISRLAARSGKPS